MTASALNPDEMAGGLPTTLVDGRSADLEGDAEELRAQRVNFREAEPAWSVTSLRYRLGILRSARHLLAERSALLVDAISPELSRNRADTLVAEVLPLLAAIKFLERRAAAILAPRLPAVKDLPFWLANLTTRIDRVPLGTILIIAPANYPLLLPGIQALQALAAGNTVVWKPGRGGGAVAEVMAQALIDAGLPPGVLRVTDESTQAGIDAIESGTIAKIVFTGSASAGRAVQHAAAEKSIPVIAELSGCDAAFVLPSANPDLVLDALCFGMRLNGSATCMAPRRLFLIGDQAALLTRLRERFAAMPAIKLPSATSTLLAELLADARDQGAEILGQYSPDGTTPLLVLNGSAAMRLAQTDLFAPVLTVFQVADGKAAYALNKLCPLSLTASVFGERERAKNFSTRLTAGTVLVNDLIVPTADPRIPFGGRGASGFGVTRGAEGLLEMTAVRTTSVRQGRSRRHFQPTTPAHEAFFTGIITASHAGTWRERFSGMRKLITAAKQLK